MRMETAGFKGKTQSFDQYAHVFDLEGGRTDVYLIHALQITIKGRQSSLADHITPRRNVTPAPA